MLAARERGRRALPDSGGRYETRGAFDSEAAVRTEFSQSRSHPVHISRAAIRLATRVRYRLWPAAHTVRWRAESPDPARAFS